MTDYITSRILRLLTNEIGDNETQMASVAAVDNQTLAVTTTDGKQYTVSISLSETRSMGL